MWDRGCVRQLDSVHDSSDLLAPQKSIRHTQSLLLSACF